MSEACKEEFNYEYDRCIFEENYNLIREAFNCSFGFLLNSFEMEITSKLNECSIYDITSIRSFDAFNSILKDINQGKYLVRMP